MPDLEMLERPGPTPVTDNALSHTRRFVGQDVYPDLYLDFQALRHTRLARLARAFIARRVVGPGGWPLRFSAPKSPDDSPRGVSPHLYVHLPFCHTLCPHCPYTKVRYDAGRHRAYGRALEHEIAAYLERPDIPPVRSIYFGGGTPTATPDLMERVLAVVRPRLIAGAEVGVEVHPADASPEMLARLRAMGVTRISLGVESFRPDLLKRLGRRYTPEAAEATVRAAMAAGFECVDVNLIFGIPGQAPDDPARDAERCLALGIHQISAYQLFTFVHTPLGERIRRGEERVYGERARLRAQRALAEVCRAHGLERTSPWNYTRPGVSPYSTVTQEDYVGFGAGAGTKVDGGFRFNTFSIEAYCGPGGLKPALTLQTDERFRRAHWLYWKLYGLRVDAAEYQGLFGRDLSRDFGPVLWALRLSGMAWRERGVYHITDFGAVWMHRIQQLFSITSIDDLWESCQKEAWPLEVVLA